MKKSEKRYEWIVEEDVSSSWWPVRLGDWLGYKILRMRRSYGHTYLNFIFKNNQFWPRRWLAVILTRII